LESGLKSLSTPFSSWHLLFLESWDHRTRDLDGYHSTYSPYYLNTILFVEYKMVVLTIVMQQNEATIYFEGALPEAKYVRLLSCSFFNLWHNLSSVGRMFFKGTNDVVASLPEGHYNVESITKELQSSFEYYKKKGKLVLETNNPNSVLKITTVAANLGNTNQAKEVSVDYSLANFLGIGRNMRKEEYSKKLNSPSCYFIHCDLVDSTKNFLNGKKSNLLAKVDIRGKPYEKVSYNIDSSQNAFRDASTDRFINNITISVKDENDELFDFKSLPLLFELELN